VTELNIDTGAFPTDFEILRKWCGWVTSPKVLAEGEELEEGEKPYVVNATTFGMLVDFLRGGDSIAQKVLTFDRSLVDGDQEAWNTKMDKVETLTTAQLMAMPKVVTALIRAGKALEY
jgi:hypothetical protein